jgi:hypothetical protein
VLSGGEWLHAERCELRQEEVGRRYPTSTGSHPCREARLIVVPGDRGRLTAVGSSNATATILASQVNSKNGQLKSQQQIGQDGENLRRSLPSSARLSRTAITTRRASPRRACSSRALRLAQPAGAQGLLSRAFSFHHQRGQPLRCYLLAIPLSLTGPIGYPGRRQGHSSARHGSPGPGGGAVLSFGEERRQWLSTPSAPRRRGPPGPG